MHGRGREAARTARGAASCSSPAARFVFDVFAPSAEDISETQGLWLEREPGIFERADWDAGTRTLRLSVRSGERAASMELALALGDRVAAPDRRGGLRRRALYGWFDRRPYRGGEDMIWVCRRAPAPLAVPTPDRPTSTRVPRMLGADRDRRPARPARDLLRSRSTTGSSRSATGSTTRGRRSRCSSSGATT